MRLKNNYFTTPRVATLTVVFLLHVRSFGWEHAGVGVIPGVVAGVGVVEDTGEIATGSFRKIDGVWMSGACAFPNDAALCDSPESGSGWSLRRWPWRFNSPPSCDIIRRSLLNLFRLAKSTSRLTTDAPDSALITNDATTKKLTPNTLLISNIWFIVACCNASQTPQDFKTINDVSSARAKFGFAADKY